ncbi:bifunctional 3-phenylpropionate/cinnamic acid dioxygenase ferredoxin subunit [Saccharopolyspora griseoalba]|uniref:Bifunctional 3-phenylpropionate/cinnamic acid dioxygenase ferredoxin subunit n=1 Tax=Saccharopolyspora griseoalba TaxID=1431848 RepID=A0ABW2LMH7_9PSEU
MTTRRVRACALQEIPPGTAIPIDGLPPLVVFNVEGELCAMDDVCSHAFAVLSEGHFDGTAIECPLHMSRFDPRTGDPLCGPATEPVRTHPVELDGEDVIVHVGGR